MVEEKMSAKLKMRRKILSSILIVLFILSISLALGIPTIAKDESSKEPKVRRWGVEDPQEVPDSRGDVEYWALVIGISDYPGEDNDLTLCDDDAIDISSALVDHQGWDPDHVILLLDQEATWDNVIAHLGTLAENLDSNDVFLLTFSGHGTNVPDDDGDEADLRDEVLVLHNNYNLIFLSDDTLEEKLEGFETDKIMVFLDSCFSGGFIKATSEFGEEYLVCRSLPGTQLVKLEDSFGRDLNKAGFVVLTACDEHEVCWESGALQNGVFTYFFVEGIESGFLADLNTNGYISAEEAFNYASPLTTAYVTWDDQHPQLYDGVPGELEITTTPAHISINIDPNDINFETIYKGYSGTETVNVMTTGNTVARITAELTNEQPFGFYSDNLELDFSTVIEWSIPSLSPNIPTHVVLTLDIPPVTDEGTKTAMLTFWAETI